MIQLEITESELCWTYVYGKYDVMKLCIGRKNIDVAKTDNQQVSIMIRFTLVGEILTIAINVEWW